MLLIRFVVTLMLLYKVYLPIVMQKLKELPMRLQDNRQNRMLIPMAVILMAVVHLIVVMIGLIIGITLIVAHLIMVGLMELIGYTRLTISRRTNWIYQARS